MAVERRLVLSCQKMLVLSRISSFLTRNFLHLITSSKLYYVKWKLFLWPYQHKGGWKEVLSCLRRKCTFSRLCFFKSGCHQFDLTLWQWLHILVQIWFRILNTCIWIWEFSLHNTYIKVTLPRCYATTCDCKMILIKSVFVDKIHHIENPPTNENKLASSKMRKLKSLQADWQADKSTTDELTSWQIDKLPNWQEDNMTRWQDDKMTRW